MTVVSVVVAAQDSRFSDHEWGERSFPYLELFDRPLGPPKGDAVEVTPRVWHREFEHVSVELRVDCEQLPRNCSTISTKSDDGDLWPLPPPISISIEHGVPVFAATMRQAGVGSMNIVSAKRACRVRRRIPDPAMGVRPPPLPVYN